MIRAFLCDIGKFNGHPNLNIGVAILFSLALHGLLLSLFVLFVRDGGPNQVGRLGESGTGSQIISVASLHAHSGKGTVVGKTPKLIAPLEDIASSDFLGGVGLLNDFDRRKDGGGEFGRLGFSLFFPQEMLDRPPVPVFAPAYKKYLSNSGVSGGVVKIRLYIDSEGKVVKVEALTPVSAEYLAPFVGMFQGTAFIPGNLQGRDVSSTLDIEMDLVEIH